MRSIAIREISITDLDTDAIVNAANAGLQAGGGVCGAIFEAAGYSELQKACDQIGHCDTGFAVITPGFKLKAKYVIHAVGPIWRGGEQNEPQLLYSCYWEALRLAREQRCRSIGFPLISSGIYGYPKEAAWRRAMQACRDFLRQNGDCELEILFAVLDGDGLRAGQKALREIAPEYANNVALDRPSLEE